MRNIIIVSFVVISLMWLFFTTILLEGRGDVTTISSDGDKGSGKYLEASSANIKKLALLLKVDYLEEKEPEKKEVILTTFDIDVSVVAIYTSNHHKVRVRVTADKEKKERDMVVGDTLYDYEVTAINPSFVVLANGENDIILKVFKNTIISITDVPKDLPDSL